MGGYMWYETLEGEEPILLPSSIIVSVEIVMK